MSAGNWTFEIDGWALANLVAQPRFSQLEQGEALKAAVMLAKEAHMIADGIPQSWRDYIFRQEPIPGPKKWPATTDDFYRFVIKAKNKEDAQPRLRAFLRSANLDHCTKQGLSGSGLIAEADRLTDLHFQSLKRIDRDYWNAMATDYLNWWLAASTENKRKAGRARAAKAAQKKSKKTS